MTRGSWYAFVGMVIFTMGTSIVTPLFPLYKETFDISNGTVTLVFAAYTVTVVPTMLIAGNLSDVLGRKRLILPGMAAITLASLVFGFTTSLPMLFVGRILQGLAIGMFLGVGTAFVVDHALPHRRAFAGQMAGLGFRLGFGLGPGIAGLMVQYGSDPLHRPFQAHAVLMVVAIAAILLTSETLRRRPNVRFSIRVGVPAGQMWGFATFLAPAAFLLSYLDATLLSLAPLYMNEVLMVDNAALYGLVGFLVLAAGGATPILFRSLEPRRAVILGVCLSASFSSLVVAAAAAETAVMVIVAAGVIGFTNGLILQGATAIAGIIVPIEERGKLVSTLYMCAYSGTLPSVALGYLSRAIGLTWTMAIFSAFALSLAAFIMSVGRRALPEVVPYRAVGERSESTVS